MNCPKCKGDLYCIDTYPILFGDVTNKGGHRNKAVLSAARERRYCCVDCDRRFKSIEILMPHSYLKKPIPRAKRRKLFGE